MRSWLADWWIRIHASYWFIPSIMSAAAVIGAIAIVNVDMQIQNRWISGGQWLFANQPAGARAVLSTVAGSMITVAGVTFSMTLLAVSHASAQMGPRLIAGFMRDRGNQFTLGTFIATFLYCLMVLRTVRGGVDGDPSQSVFVPQLSVVGAVGLATLSVFVLIYFIHHVPQSINVTTVVSRVGDELVDSIEHLFPERLGSGEGETAGRTALPDDFDTNCRHLLTRVDAGYLRVLDAEGLMAIAKDNALILRLYRRPGDFAVPGQPLMCVWPAERLTDETEAALYKVWSWGSARTREQDVMFPVDQLVEVLARAMSPGVNGQHTALLCIDQLERAFAALLKRSVPDHKRYDEEGQLRVVAQPVTHKEVILLVVRQLRQFVRDDWFVTRHLLRMLDRLSEMPALAASRPLLVKASAIINDDVDRGVMADSEKRALQ